MTNANINEFREITKNIVENSKVQELKNYVQHIYSSRYSHCEEVALYTYIICKKLNLNYISATRGAMLHDFYFYDYRNKSNAPKHFHLFKHPRNALSNASDIFDLNDLEKDIILNHMWPVTFIRVPKYLETYIVTFVDKYCATIEFFKSILMKGRNIYDKSFN